MRSSWFTRKATSEAGFTVLEMLIVASIAVVVSVAFYDALRQGWLFQTGAARLEEAQAAASQALREIADGAPDGSVPGLVSARAVAYGASALAYAAAGREVSYYLAGGTLYRAVEPEDGALEVRGSGGVPVAEGITVFEAGAEGKLVALTVAAGDPSSGRELVRLSTKVRPRNWTAEGGAPGGQPDLPWVATRDATGVAATSAVLNMEYDFKGYQSGQVQFAYRPSGGTEWTYTPWVERAGSGVYSETVGGLAPNTTYSFKARLKHDTNVLEGGELFFATLPRAAPAVTTTDARDVDVLAVGGGRAVGTVRVEASVSFGDYSQVEICVRYVSRRDRFRGESWTYTSWEAVTSTSYTKDIFRQDWAAGETYYFEAVIRFGSPYEYGYGGEKAVRMPERERIRPPEPPPPPGDETR